jgi:four helix bundle protein
MTNFRTYQASISFFKLCRSVQLPYYLKDQLLRAASSITLNLAEGSSKESKKDQKRFYNIDYASLSECRAVFDLYDIMDMDKETDTLGAMLYCLIKSRK